MIKVTIDALGNEPVQLYDGEVELGVTLIAMVYGFSLCPPYGSAGWLQVVHLEDTLVVVEVSTYLGMGVGPHLSWVKPASSYRYSFRSGSQQAPEFDLFFKSVCTQCMAHPRNCGPVVRAAIHGG